MLVLNMTMRKKRRRIKEVGNKNLPIKDKILLHCKTNTGEKYAHQNTYTNSFNKHSTDEFKSDNIPIAGISITYFN